MPFPLIVTRHQLREPAQAARTGHTALSPVNLPPTPPLVQIEQTLSTRGPGKENDRVLQRAAQRASASMASALAQDIRQVEAAAAAAAVAAASRQAHSAAPAGAGAQAIPGWTFAIGFSRNESTIALSSRCAGRVKADPCVATMPAALQPRLQAQELTAWQQRRLGAVSSMHRWKLTRHDSYPSPGVLRFSPFNSTERGAFDIRTGWAKSRRMVRLPGTAGAVQEVVQTELFLSVSGECARPSNYGKRGLLRGRQKHYAGLAWWADGS